jgi:hypothetical protein
LTNNAGCDSLVTINLVFNIPSTGTETYNGCAGDGYSIIANGTTYDESNPTGVEILTNSVGCDSIVTINLIFNNPSTGTESYTGCVGDGLFYCGQWNNIQRSNPTGTEILTNSIGCDSLVTITLVYNNASTGIETYTGCVGDGYSVVVNGTTYNEGNPSGIETMINSAGCDSIVTIALSFNSATTGTESYNGCSGDGYSIVVNGTTYNEGNPTGVETMTNGSGCDSIVTISLVFNNVSTGSVTYTGCVGDGYSVIVNGTLYYELNPSGIETLTNSIGCDSIVAITLLFNNPSTGTETYTGCVGDGYSVVVNGTTIMKAIQVVLRH